VIGTTVKRKKKASCKHLSLRCHRVLGTTTDREPCGGCN